MDTASLFSRVMKPRDRHRTRYKSVFMEGGVSSFLFTFLALFVALKHQGVCGESVEMLQCSYASSSGASCPQVCTSDQFFFLLPSSCQPASEVNNIDTQCTHCMHTCTHAHLQLYTHACICMYTSILMQS